MKGLKPGRKAPGTVSDHREGQQGTAVTRLSLVAYQRLYLRTIFLDVLVLRLDAR